MHRNASKRVPRRLGVATLVVATFFFASSPTLAQEGGAKIDDARALLEKWVEARRVLSKEARDLELAKETLRAQQELLRREIESLKAKIEEAKKSLADVDKKKEELVLESEALKATTSVLESAVAPAEARARDLAARLPDPLKERLQPVVRRLPAEGEATKLSLSDRFLTIVGLLNETDKFQREVVVRSEVRPLADGTSAEVTAIYPGLGAAYYVDGRGLSAGVGKPSDKGFAWTARNEIAEAVKKVAAILKNEVPAAFVRVPVDAR